MSKEARWYGPRYRLQTVVLPPRDDPRPAARLCAGRVDTGCRLHHPRTYQRQLCLRIRTPAPRRYGVAGPGAGPLAVGVSHPRSPERTGPLDGGADAGLYRATGPEPDPRGRVVSGPPAADPAHRALQRPGGVETLLRSGGLLRAAAQGAGRLPAKAALPSGG